ncbi:dienelactone hydrolase family protein [Candidatus Poriferisocius sp.]|uniref:dienelactone hydrolase family protein n=1 Tax=Candidatus Poriferisocius sp. TaxID=3101276 RepID=UPI003B020F6E
MRIELSTGTAAELVRVEGADRGLVLIPDLMGLRPLFDDHVARLATEQGWTVCAPQVFAGREHLEAEERMAAVRELVDDEVLADVLAAADATECETVVLTGFCMGGMYTIKAAATGRFHRAAAFYGMIRIPDDWQGSGQGEPLEHLAAGDPCPLLAIIGTEDPFTPPDDVTALEAAGAVVVSYEGADHGFVHDPVRPAHRPDDAADAWARVIEFLSQ